jgi:hypothetical protein
MKKGKTSKLNGFKTSKVIYGTVDSKDFKSIYLNIQTWVQPKVEVENWTRLVLNMNRAVKHSVHENLDKELFDDKFIVDLDLRTSGIQLDKKSFMNLEINLYMNQQLDFKSPELKLKLRELTQQIYYDVFNDNEYFDFYLTKNGNYKVEKVKTEKV